MSEYIFKSKILIQINNVTYVFVQTKYIRLVL